MSSAIRPLPDPEIPPPRRDWKELTLEAALVLPNVVQLLGRLARDRRVPIRRKALAVAVAIYVISPIDLIPDLFFGIGFLDDIILSAVALHHLMQGAGRDVVMEHWDGSEDSLDLVLAVFEWGAEVIPAPLRKSL